MLQEPMMSSSGLSACVHHTDTHTPTSNLHQRQKTLVTYKLVESFGFYGGGWFVSFFVSFIFVFVLKQDFAVYVA